MKTLLKCAAVACGVLVCILWLRGAAIDDAGRLFVSSGATNNAQITGFASMVMATGNVNTAASIGPNKFTNFSYSISSGNVGISTNTWIIVTNAGRYRLSMGAGLLAGNNNQMSLQWWTNGPGITPAHCSILQTDGFMGTAAAVETGFKMVTVFLPAGTHIFLQTTNSAATAQTLKNVCFSVGAVN